MAEVKICDRCRKELGKDYWSFKLTQEGGPVLDSLFGGGRHLCHDCKAVIDKVMNKKEY